MQLETQTNTLTQNPPPPMPPEQGSELTALSVIRTETVLSKLPVHNLAKKGRVDIQIVKLGPKGEVELKWEVSYSERYGQARQLAYKLDTIVIDPRVELAGRPLPERLRLGSARELAQELDLGHNIAKLKRAFHQNASAYITAKLKYKGNDGSEHMLEAGFTRYSVIFTGDKFSDGTKADAVYIELHPRYREVLNNAPTRPLNLEYKKQLAPGPQRFYEIVSYKIFAALKNNLPMARLTYSEYCTFSAQQRYTDYDHFKKQMYKIHRPHLKSGYITKASYDQTTDEQGRMDWQMNYIPGPKARTEYATFTGKKLRPIDAAASELGAGESPYRRPRQRRLNLKPATEPQSKSAEILPPIPVLDPQQVAALTSRGVSEAASRKVLADLPADFAVVDTLEWGDQQVATQRGKIQNPPGFYISLLRDRVIPPPTFETSRLKTARREAELERQQREEAAVAEAAAHEEADRQKADQLLATLSPQEQANLEGQVRADLKAKYPKINWDGESAMHDGTIRAGIRRLLQEHSVPSVLHPIPATVLPPAEQGSGEEQPFTPLTQAQLIGLLMTLQLPPPKLKS